MTPQEFLQSTTDSANIANLRQSLIEHMGDWLDKDSTKFEMQFAVLGENEDCHLIMAKAAFNEFLKNCAQQPPAIATQSEFDEWVKRSEALGQMQITLLADGEKMAELEETNAELLITLSNLVEAHELPFTADYQNEALQRAINLLLKHRGGYSKTELECKGCMGPCGMCGQVKIDQLEAEIKNQKAENDDHLEFAKITKEFFVGILGFLEDWNTRRHAESSIDAMRIKFREVVNKWAV